MTYILKISLFTVQLAAKSTLRTQRIAIVPRHAAYDRTLLRILESNGQQKKHDRFKLTFLFCLVSLQVLCLGRLSPKNCHIWKVLRYSATRYAHALRPSNGQSTRAIQILLRMRDVMSGDLPFIFEQSLGSQRT